MATLPRSYIDAYTKALNEISEDARKRLADDLARIDFTADVATVRDAVIERMEFYLGPYTDMAAVIAAEFYDAVRAYETGAKLGAVAVSGRKPIATEKAVRGIMQTIAEGGEAASAVAKLLDRADYEVKRSAGECVYRNGQRDPLKPRYARVPSGAETCGFCIMLASRGFVYHSKQSAGANGHYHANCDCRIVPGFEGVTKIEGYDTDALYEQYVEAIGSGKLSLKQVRDSSTRTVAKTGRTFGSYMDFVEFVEDAKDIEDLQQRCAIAQSEWRYSGLGDSRWQSLARVVMNKKRSLS